MGDIRITGEYGVLIRRSALPQRSVELKQVLDIFGSERLDENAELISFGPCFGQEGLESVCKSLQELGLVYWDDFIETAVDVPEWCELRASHR